MPRKGRPNLGRSTKAAKDTRKKRATETKYKANARRDEQRQRQAELRQGETDDARQQ